MESLTIVKHFDIFKYILLSLTSGLALMMNQFSFHSMKEAFRDRVVPTVPFTAHTLPDAILI